jgi:hypothetical protein
LSVIDPPTSYLSPPVDIWGGLDYLQQQAADNKFGNQFEFDTALSDLFISAKDGHLSLIPCSYMPFAFVGHESLVSVSSDGLQLPQIYTFGMFVGLIYGNGADLPSQVMPKSSRVTPTPSHPL